MDGKDFNKITADNKTNMKEIKNSEDTDVRKDVKRPEYPHILARITSIFGWHRDDDPYDPENSEDENNEIQKNTDDEINDPEDDNTDSYMPSDIENIGSDLIEQSGLEHIARITEKEEKNIKYCGKAEITAKNDEEAENDKDKAEKDIRQLREKISEERREYFDRQIPAYVKSDLLYGEHKNNTVRNVILCMAAGSLFCIILAGSIALSSEVISKQITASSATTTEKLVSSINKAVGRPVDSIGGAEMDTLADKASANDPIPSDNSSDTSLPSQDELANVHMKCIAQYPAAVQKAFGVSWKEIFAFDAMVKHVVDETSNPIIAEIFSEDVTAPINYISDGYKIWSYIMSVRSAGKFTSGIEPGVALLEAASLVKYSTEYNVPLALAVGVTQTESSFNPACISNKDALGPMQVVYGIHSGLLTKVGITKREEMFTADKGVQAGCFILGRFLKDEKSVIGGLKRYYGALSPKYVNFVISHRHTYELYSSGIDKNVAEMMNKENVNWNKMTEIKQPVIRAGSAGQGSSEGSVSVSRRSKSGHVSHAMVQTSSVSESQNKPVYQQGPAPMTVYKNTGSIVIKNPDGVVTNTWSQ